MVRKCHYLFCALCNKADLGTWYKCINELLCNDPLMSLYWRHLQTLLSGLTLNASGELRTGSTGKQQKLYMISTPFVASEAAEDVRSRGGRVQKAAA